MTEPVRKFSIRRDTTKAGVRWTVVRRTTGTGLRVISVATGASFAEAWATSLSAEIAKFRAAGITHPQDTEV